MNKIEKIEAGGFYLFVGRSNANSCFIEKLIHGKKFLVYANFFLKNYLSIYDYIITKDGWSMLVKIRSERVIQAIGNNEQLEVWRSVSERVRLFLSTFVRVTNKEKGRTGCLVHSSYERYSFENKDEALNYIERMRKQQIKFYAKKKKYRALKTHYRIDVNKNKGSVFLCSRDVRKKREECLEFGEVVDFIELSDVVVKNLVNFTKNKLFHPTLNNTT